MICQILQGVRSEESYLCKCKQCFFFYKTCEMSNRYWFFHEIPFLYRQSPVIKSTTGFIAINTYNVLSTFTLFTSKKLFCYFPIFSWIPESKETMNLKTITLSSKYSAVPQHIPLFSSYQSWLIDLFFYNRSFQFLVSIPNLINSWWYQSFH